MGDELTLGQSLDTNAQWLAQQLVARGIVPVEHVTVPDDLDAVMRTLARAARESDLILCTGGLGPTADDLTREAVAKVSGDVLVEDSRSLAEISAWFASRGRTMPRINAVQALRPSRASAITNAWGTAPGIAAVIPRSHGAGEREGGGVDCFCVPGPPSEMKPMFEAAVASRLEPPAGLHVITAAIHTVGLGESEIATRLGDLMRRDAAILVGTTASMGVVSIRVRSERFAELAQARAEVDQILRTARQAVAGHIVGEGDESTAQSLVDELRRRGERLAVVESCTGGLLGELITAVAGSSDVMVGGWITYSNEMKRSQVGVEESLLAEHGAVSAQVARAMARGGLERSGADHCISITGIAGPGGGTAQKPVGTVFICHVARGGAEDCRHFRMMGGRETVRQWSARAGMLMAIFAARGARAPGMLREVVGK